MTKTKEVNGVPIPKHLQYLSKKKLLALIGYEKCSQVRGKQINELRRN